jgi:hypothetical protein
MGEMTPSSNNSNSSQMLFRVIGIRVYRNNKYNLLLRSRDENTYGRETWLKASEKHQMFGKIVKQIKMSGWNNPIEYEVVEDRYGTAKVYSFVSRVVRDLHFGDTVENFDSELLVVIDGCVNKTFGGKSFGPIDILTAYRSTIVGFITK